MSPNTNDPTLDNQVLWRLIHAHFNENTQHLVSHHIESYDDFMEKDIFAIFRDQNPITLVSGNNNQHKCNLYLGGKDGTRVYFGKPMIHDKERGAHYMYPNEARLRNMTYAMTVHYDLEVEWIDLLEPGQEPYAIGPEFVGGEGEDQEGGNEDYTSHFMAEQAANVLNYKAGGDSDIMLSNQVLSDNSIGMSHGVTDSGIKIFGGDSSLVGSNLIGGSRLIKKAKLTPNQAAKLRDLNEQSMVSPNTQKRTMVFEKIYLGKIPIMVQSKQCILHGMSRELRHGFGECKNDPGGYFIIAGKEKTIAVQEKFGDNLIYIKRGKPAPHEEGVADDFLWSAEIRSVSENVSKPKRGMSVRLMAPSSSFTNEQIVVNIPNVRAPVPLFIVFRALGILSDREIIQTCLLDMEKYEFMVDAFVPSVHDAGGILQQSLALTYIGELTKYHSADYALEVLHDFFLPHIGESNFTEKAFFLGHMVFRLLSASMGLDSETDRDHLKYKRIEPFGTLFRDLFQEYYAMQQKSIFQEFESRIYFNNNEYEHNLFELVYNNYREIFGNRIVDEGIRKAFKGSWGATAHTKRVGIVQDLNRLSFNSALSHLRKINLPLDSSLKVVGPRILHCSHWGYIDFIDTPDGANIGLHKTFAITTYVSRGYSRENMIAWLYENVSMKRITECLSASLASQTKVFVNGYWAGMVETPLETVAKMRLYRRNGLLPIHTSVAFDIRQNMVQIYTDAGRMCRPIFYKDDITKQFSFQMHGKRLKDGEINWSEMVSGFNPKRADAKYHYNDIQIRPLGDLYEGSNGETNPAKLDRFLKQKAVIEYIDSNESEHALIAQNVGDWTNHPDKQARYTHMEIHPSFLFGIMCNQVIFPENNPAARISFSCSQSRQACSVYHTNYQVRMDKTAVVLNQGQIPLLKSRYMTHLNREENPYGENAIVAIMCYTGYNVEDAILVNEGALKRGLFQTTYYTSYQEHEERKQLGDQVTDKKFTCIESDPTVMGLKPGHDYSKLDEYGLIRENTPIDDKTILIGYTASGQDGRRKDASVTTKKGQLGIVDKAFITEGEEGERIAKVRIREIRVPNQGDKMASRAGQKGTVGLVIPEKDMPFTKDGIRPDLIINPHALPTRQTIGHLVECLIGKAAVHFGGFSDCTAFNNEGSKAAMFGKLLPRLGYHSSGNEIVYNGMTGEQIDMEIFVGPNYYMRLKHMVKDKVNYRALGPRTALTKQPVAGRANDGGLRIGEMERDVLISHGMTDFLRESMMERGDKYCMAVCNTTGLLAIYNPTKKRFLSPMADGPLQFFKGETSSTGYTLETVSKYGRKFSLVEVPYSLKLLIQELQAINVQLRIITEDNIDQMENMAFSDNIGRLTIDPNMTPEKLVASIKNVLQVAEPPLRTPLPLVEEPELTPDYPETSPAYVPPVEEVELSPESLQYNPEMPPGEPLAPQTPLGEPLAPQTPPEEPKQETFLESAAKTVSSLFSAPPEQGEKKVGGGVDDYQLGGNVYYIRSRELGLPADHLWSVRKKGAKLLTIQSMDNDAIQIAKCDELIRPDSVAAMRLRQNVVSPSPMVATSQPHFDSPMPQIHVNPIIKIVNGNDHSAGQEHVGSSEPTANAYEPTFTTLQIQKPQRIETPIVPEIPEKTLFEGATDFGKLVIHKLGGGGS